MAYDYDDWLRCVRADERRLKGDFDGAIADFTEAIRINPNIAAAFTNRGMAREAALRATDDQVRQLEVTLQRQRACLGDADAFIAADMAFHTQIAAFSV